MFFFTGINIKTNKVVAIKYNKFYTSKNKLPNEIKAHKKALKAVEGTKYENS